MRYFALGDALATNSRSHARTCAPLLTPVNARSGSCERYARIARHFETRSPTRAAPGANEDPASMLKPSNPGARGSLAVRAAYGCSA